MRGAGKSKYLFDGGPVLGWRMPPAGLRKASDGVG